MHKQLSLALTVLMPNVNFFENSIEPDINSIEYSVDPDQRPADQDSHCSRSGSTPFLTTCKFKIINPI